MSATFVRGALLAAFVSFLTSPLAADPVWRITELYRGGLDGEDGTNDWFEITNFGDMTGDTGGLFYDDVSRDLEDAGQLDSLMVPPGASAVFLVTDDGVPENEVDFANSIEEFEAIWGGGILIGLTNGGGGLGGSDDEANIGTNDGGTMAVIDSAAYGAVADNSLATLDYHVGDALDSALGVGGAYESAAFFNGSLGAPNDMVTLVGSPGQIPEPGSVLLLLVTAVAAVAIRRGSRPS